MASRPVKLAALSAASVLVATALCALAIEAWARLTWNDRKGTPGFFLSDAARRQRLAPGYRGWFAGVPVSINNLGFRDDRDVDPAKPPRAFRILVLGDSVTFGHGSVYEHSYPVLLEKALRAWRPDVEWQVLNAAVPGYNTSQELAQLLEIGPTLKPDLVVVGFFENDVVDNFPVAAPGAAARLRSALLSFAYRHVYSVEFYKRLVLQAAWRLSGATGFRQRLDNLGAERDLIAKVDQLADLDAQRLTPFDRLSSPPPDSCPDQPPLPADVVESIQHEPGYSDWLAAVRRLQQLHREGTYSIVFFANVAPRDCPATDRFFDGGTSAINDFYMRLFADGTPAVSVYDAFLPLRPSQMPFAKGHSLGNANAVKADVLFRFLRDAVLANRPLPTR